MKSLLLSSYYGMWMALCCVYIGFYINMNFTFKTRFKKKRDLKFFNVHRHIIIYL